MISIYYYDRVTDRTYSFYPINGEVWVNRKCKLRKTGKFVKATMKDPLKDLTKLPNKLKIIIESKLNEMLSYKKYTEYIKLLYSSVYMKNEDKYKKCLENISIYCNNGNQFNEYIKNILDNLCDYEFNLDYIKMIIDDLYYVMSSFDKRLYNKNKYIIDEYLEYIKEDSLKIFSKKTNKKSKRKHSFNNSKSKKVKNNIL